MHSIDLYTLVMFGSMLLLAGAVAGTMAGLLGVGGGMIIVPILLYVFRLLEVDPNHSMHLAVGTSLSTIVVTSMMSVRAHHRRGSIDWLIVRSWIPWLVVGVFFGTGAAWLLDASGLKVVFGVMALLVAAWMAFAKEGFAISSEPPRGVSRTLVASGIGGVSTLIGIGGGTFTVPTLVMASVEPRRAVGTASAVGIFIAIPATIGFVLVGWDAPDLPPLSMGYVNLAAFTALIPMTSLFAPVGAKIAHSISGRNLKRAFALFLLVNGSNILYSAL